MRFTPALAALALALSACACATPSPTTALTETQAPEPQAARPSEQEQLAAYWAARENPPPYIRIGSEFAPPPPAPEGELFLSDDQLDRDAERLERQSRAFHEAVRRSMEE